MYVVMNLISSAKDNICTILIEGKGSDGRCLWIRHYVG